MKIELLELAGIGPAMKAMRNPMDSWAKGDSEFGLNAKIGHEDLKLGTSLARAGRSHRKFLRMINVWFDVTAPIYWYSEFDTYKVGVTRLSCSTMHKLGTRTLTEADFEGGDVMFEVLHELNSRINIGKTSGRSASLTLELKRILPASYLQTSTVSTNYEALLNMYNDRCNHRLPEWREVFCPWVEKLYMMPEFIDATKG